MDVNQVNVNSPIRILERCCRGGLRPGELGVVMARAGVGKTAFLVQIGLDDALRGNHVLHVALGQDLEHVQSWYDALFDDLAEATRLDDREVVRQHLIRHRVIQAYADTVFPHEWLDDLVALYGKTGFTPAVVVVDGLRWEREPIVEQAAELGALKQIAKRLGAILWVTAQTHRELTPSHPTAVPPPCDDYNELIDLAVFLEPEGTDVTVRLLKDHDALSPEDTHLQLHSDTMRLVEEGAAEFDANLPTPAFTVLSGGAVGAEAAFGAAAERWGVQETNFSFAGRQTARRRGVVELSDVELERGAVSKAYIKAQLHRVFPATSTFQRLLKTLWHQVATAGEVFVVGEILDDDTVKGGTGWGAELAKHLRKPLHVFDQPRNQWFSWSGEAWTPVDAPRIRRTRFTGAGTRSLTEEGRHAIEALFERSFGPVRKDTAATEVSPVLVSQG